MIFSLWFLLFTSALECSCSRINLREFMKGLRRNMHIYEINEKPMSTTKSATLKKKTVNSTPKPKRFQFQMDFSFSSMLTGVAISAAAFYYLDNRNLSKELIKCQLLLEQKDDITDVNFDKLVKDERFFLEAVTRKNQRLCLLLLRSGAQPKILNDFGDNLLVKLIENDLIEVVNFLLSTDLKLVAIDVMDESTGKTPLLAAIKSKHFNIAKKLLEMGAKPMIPTTSKYPARSMNDFLNEISNSDSPEAAELLNYFDKLFKKK